MAQKQHPNEIAIQRVFEAAKSGNVEALSNIAARGINPDCRNWQNRTPLMEAARCKHLKVVQLLLRKGANVNAADYIGQRVLFHAMSVPRNGAVLRLLLKSGAQPDCRDRLGNTALITFAKDKLIENIREILKYKPRLNLANRGGDTALTNAAAWGSFRVLKLLIAAGANIQKRDGVGCTALDLANSQRHEPIVAFLTELGNGTGTQLVPFQA